MQRMYACLATAHESGGSVEKKKNKFPPRPVKKLVTAKSVCDDTHKRYPRIMARLAK